MGFVINELNKMDKRELLHSLPGLFLAYFAEFAIAVHQGTGLPMIGIFKDGVLQHVAIECPDGRMFDARGFVETSSKRFLEKWLTDGVELTLTPVTEAKLRAIRVVDKDGYRVEQARVSAEILFPELPWKNGGDLKRVHGFLGNLQHLFLKYGVKVEVPFEISIQTDEEMGRPNMYAIHPSVTRYKILSE